MLINRSGFNQGMNKLWDWNNRGVSPGIDTDRSVLIEGQRQWKDIRHKFIEAAEEEE